jgi:hypothetical protein
VPTLRRLFITGAPLASIPPLDGLAALHRLHITYLKGPGAFPALPPRIAELDVHGCEADVLDVSACTELEKLWLTGRTTSSVVGLESAKRLHLLWLNDTSLPRPPTMALDALATLWSTTPLTDLESLRGAPVLTDLHLRNAKDLRGFDVLATLPRLTKLELSGGTPYWVARKECPLLPTVKHLVISDQNVEDTHFVADWAPALETLTFDGCTGFLELVGLGGFASLREISLKRTAMQAKDIPRSVRDRGIKVVLR